ncbi:hypothetical protein SGLAM104S_04199 [Streptomyces glaucescens]
MRAGRRAARGTAAATVASGASSPRHARTWPHRRPWAGSRSSFAPGDARTLRADGPGWSLVARTDDIAFVLLDDDARGDPAGGART